MAFHLGLFAARAFVGGTMFAHGGQKAFGWFEGPGPDGTAKFMSSLGFEPADTYGRIASYNELVSGGLIALGAFGPVGPALMISNMIVAATTVHAPNGFFAQKNGYELPALYAATALALASSGYGAISFDKITGLDKGLGKSGPTFWAVAFGVAGAIIALAQRDVVDDAPSPGSPAPAEPSAAPPAQNGSTTAADDLGSKA